MSLPTLGLLKERTNGSAQRLSALRAGRNRSRVAAGVFLVVGLSLVFAVSYSNAGERRPVLAVARSVAPGAVITPGDLLEVRVAADPGLRTIPAANRSQVLGRVAGVGLSPGTLLNPAQLASGSAVEPGRAVVGVALEPGRFPPDLRAGDTVIVVLAPADATQPSLGADPAMGTVTTVDARVSGVTPSAGGSAATVVSLDLPQSLAPTVAVAAGHGAVSLVLTGGTR